MLRPDDAGFALVTMNRMVLEDCLQALNAAMKSTVTVWEQSCLRIQSEAKSTFHHQVKTAGEEIRKSISRDLDNAKVEAAALVKYAGQPSITDIRYPWLAGTAVVFGVSRIGWRILPRICNQESENRNKGANESCH